MLYAPFRFVPPFGHLLAIFCQCERRYHSNKTTSSSRCCVLAQQYTAYAYQKCWPQAHFRHETEYAALRVTVKEAISAAKHPDDGQPCALGVGRVPVNLVHQVCHGPRELLNADVIWVGTLPSRDAYADG